MGNYLSAPVTAKRTEWGTTASGLPYAISCMQGWRVSMEDTHIAVPSLLQHSHNLSLFACFDGHGGKFSANFACNKFVSVLRETEEFIKFEKLEYDERDDRDKGIALLRTALHECFLALDAKMLFEGSTKASCTTGRDVSGCTALVIVVTPKFVVCANAGDCRAVLTKVDKHGLLDKLAKTTQKNQDKSFDEKAENKENGTSKQEEKTADSDNNEVKANEAPAENSPSKEPKYLAIPLSNDHRPTGQAEKKRILKAGGRIIRQRIEGDLAVSRGLGDFRYKKNQSPEEQIVTCIPEISIHDRSDDADQFVVIGCDGIWDVHAKKDIIGQIVVDLSMDGKDVPHACEEILDLCLKKGSKDNMTAMLLVLPGLKYSPKELKESVKTVTPPEASDVEEEEEDIVDNVSVNLDADNVSVNLDVDNVSVNLDIDNNDNEVQSNGIAKDEDSKKNVTTTDVSKENGTIDNKAEKKVELDDQVEMVQGEH